MGFDCLDDFRIEEGLLGGNTEGAVAHMPPGAAGNLGELGRRQPSWAPAVELARAGEGDMVEIHIEPHTDCIGGDEIIDLAGLEHADLGIARARTESS